MSEITKEQIRRLETVGIAIADSIAEEYRNLETANHEQDTKMHALYCNLQGIIDNMPDYRKEGVKCN